MSFVYIWLSTWNYLECSVFSSFFHKIYFKKRLVIFFYLLLKQICCCPTLPNISRVCVTVLSFPTFTLTVVLERFWIAQNCLFSFGGRRRTIEKLHRPLGTPVLCFFMLLHHYPLSFVSILYSHLLFPVLIFILTCWFRLRGVITPPTAPGPTWTPHGGTMRAFCPPTGMYHAWPLPINKMCDAPVCWLDFFDLLISLFFVFFLLSYFIFFLF